MNDPDIDSDAGTNNDNEFSVTSNVDREFDMTEDNSICTTSREKSISSPDSIVRDRSDDRPIYPYKWQEMNNQAVQSLILQIRLPLQ